MAAGSILLRADGSRVLLADGSLLLSDGSGDSCCCCSCFSSGVNSSYCDEFTTPDTFRFAKTGGTVGSAIELTDDDSTLFYATATSASITGDAVYISDRVWQVDLSIGWTYKDGANNPYTPATDYELASFVQINRTATLDGFGNPTATGFAGEIFAYQPHWPMSLISIWQGKINTLLTQRCCLSRTLSRTGGVWSAGSATLTPCPEAGI